MKLFGARGAFLARIACIVLVPVGTFTGSMLYFIGFRWGLSILVVVSVLFCLHWPFLADADHIGDDDAADGSLPVQQPAAAHAGAPVQPHGGGLGASAIAGLPAYSYEKKAAASDECAVCLGELQSGELVKRLPACAHMFHDVCIDAWLRSNVTCPVCRSSVDATPPVAAGIVPRVE